MESTTFLLASAIQLAALGLLYILLKNRLESRAKENLTETSALLPGLLTQALQKPFLDMSDRMNRVVSDLRESTGERISKSSLESQERLERALSQNRSELQTGLFKTSESLQLRFQSLEKQVSERLEKIGENVETKLNANLKEGFKHFEKVQEHLMSAELKLQQLGTVGESISDLNQLLKLPHLRGAFGESTLERLLTDFLPLASFELQAMISPHSTERVDAIVKLAQLKLPIDAKFPREQVLPLFDAQDPAGLEAARKNLYDFIRSQSKSIADKYIKPEHGTTDMALLFLPSETLYFEVIRNGKLFEEMSKLRVYPVSPNTLAMGLQSVAVAQEYYEMSRGVEKTIEDVKKARKHFDNFGKKFEDIGRGLKKAQEAFETANGHLGRYESSVFRLIGEDPKEEAGSLSIGDSEGASAPSTPPINQGKLF
jgi:DNA recombination protein RmuC